MPERDVLATEFEQNRAHLRAVAYRMLGSLSEADDAVQESWLHVSRSGTAGVKNLGGWLTTVVARVCLDMLRSRRARREEPLDDQPAEPAPAHLPFPLHSVGGDPEQEALLADSVGPALLVVLEELAPAERLAFVLHDMFAVPFDEIAPIVGRSPAAARQLASRARRRVQGSPAVPGADLTRQRELVSAFMAASRDGDFDALLAVLDPDVVLRADRATVPAGRPTLLRGAENVVRGALAGSGRSRFAQAALVNGAVGIVLAPGGQLTIALTFSFGRGKITEIEVIADPERLRELEVAVLDG
ncbi:MAG TPA: sigma-70 family RNA polymerase sigma factor [Streptosporangiaceae bacterium]